MPERNHGRRVSEPRNGPRRVRESQPQVTGRQAVQCRRPRSSCWTLRDCQRASPLTCAQAAPGRCFLTGRAPPGGRDSLCAGGPTPRVRQSSGPSCPWCDPPAPARPSCGARTPSGPGRARRRPRSGPRAPARMAPALKSSVKPRRVRLGFVSGMVDIVSASRKMSTKSDSSPVLQLPALLEATAYRWRQSPRSRSIRVSLPSLRPSRLRRELSAFGVVLQAGQNPWLSDLDANCDAIGTRIATRTLKNGYNRIAGCPSHRRRSLWLRRRYGTWQTPKRDAVNGTCQPSLLARGDEWFASIPGSLERLQTATLAWSQFHASTGQPMPSYIGHNAKYFTVSCLGSDQKRRSAGLAF